MASARRLFPLIALAVTCATPCLSLPSDGRQVEGRRNPELVPTEVAWEMAFLEVSTRVFATDGKVRADSIAALGKYSLHIPESHVSAVAQVARAVTQRVAQIRSNEPLDRGELLAQKASVKQAVLGGRTTIRNTVPPDSYRAVERWIAKDVIPGIVADIEE